MNPVLVINDKLNVVDVTGEGVGYEAIMRPVIYSSGNPGNAYECLLDVNGFTRIALELLGINAAVTEQLVLGWSYLAGQGVAVKALVNAQVARIGAGADGVVASNVRTIQLNPATFKFELNCNQNNTVKTFYAVITGTVAGLSLSAALTKLT